MSLVAATGTATATGKPVSPVVIGSAVAAGSLGAGACSAWNLLIVVTGFAAGAKAEAP